MDSRISAALQSRERGNGTHLKPAAGRARDDVALGVEQDQLLPRRRLHADEELLVLAELRVGTSVRDDHDAIGLADACLRPRRRDGRVGHVEDDAVLLFGLSQPAVELELSHAAERVSPEDLHYGRLVEVGRRRADRFERLVKLDRKLGDGDVAVRRDDGDRLWNRERQQHRREGSAESLRFFRRSLAVIRQTLTHLQVEVVLAHAAVPHARRAQLLRQPARHLCLARDLAPQPRGDDPADLDRHERVPHRDGVEQRHGHAGELGVTDGVQGGRTRRRRDAVELSDRLALAMLGLDRDTAVLTVDDGAQTPVDDLQ